MFIYSFACWCRCSPTFLLLLFLLDERAGQLASERAVGFIFKEQINHHHQQQQQRFNVVHASAASWRAVGASALDAPDRNSSELKEACKSPVAYVQYPSIAHYFGPCQKFNENNINISDHNSRLSPLNSPALGPLKLPLDGRKQPPSPEQPSNSVQPANLGAGCWTDIRRKRKWEARVQHQPTTIDGRALI